MWRNADTIKNHPTGCKFTLLFAATLGMAGVVGVTAVVAQSATPRDVEPAESRPEFTLTVVETAGTELPATAYTKVEYLTGRFVTAMLADGNFDLLPGEWRLVNNDCEFCSGTNADSAYIKAHPRTRPYLQPKSAWRIRQDSGVVVVARLPPQVRYFGFTPMLSSRATEVGRQAFAASLSDPLNNLTIGTSEGRHPNNTAGALAVIVVTADRNLYTMVRSAFEMIGFPSDAVNLLPLPIELPLFMGEHEAADTFTLLGRIAMPEEPEALDNYIEDLPMSVITVAPFTPRAADPVGMVFSDPGADVAEPPHYESARDTLVQLITDRYAGEYEFTELTPVTGKHYGPECIELGIFCFGDNNDGAYLNLLSRFRPEDDRDITLTVGVNHQRLGRVLYQNQSVVEPERSIAVIGANDMDYEGSATYHAGLQSEARLFPDLYAYTFAYDCRGYQYCIDIPTTNETQELPAIDRATGYSLVTRWYVDPLTTVRPRISELIMVRAFEGKYVGDETKPAQVFDE